jgi:hypothetical protein
MQLAQKAVTAILFNLVAATHACAGLSRDDVRDALAAARRSGDLIAPGDSGKTLRELSPDRYPAPQQARARTREEVVAELNEALRAGDLTHGDSGLTDFEIDPAAYPARPAAHGRTRDEVRAELAEAIRTGDIMASGDSGQTLRERDPVRYAKAASPQAEHVLVSAPAQPARPC